MKKIILALILAVSFSTAANAQTFEFLGSDTVYVNGDSTVLDSYRLSHIKNTGTEDLQLVWVRIHVNTPSEWSTAVCDINLCWGEAKDTAEFTLPAGEEGEMYPHFYPQGKIGKGSLVVKVYEKENPTNADSVYYYTNVYGVGVPRVTSADVKVYPNPARTTMTVSLPESISGGVVEIYDILGNKVYTNTVTGNETVVNVATLQTGKYIMRFIDQNGTAYNKRFQKVN